MIINTINLICWIILLLFALDYCYRNKPVHPLTYLLAVICGFVNAIQKMYW